MKSFVLLVGLALSPLAAGCGSEKTGVRIEKAPAPTMAESSTPEPRTRVASKAAAQPAKTAKDAQSPSAAIEALGGSVQTDESLPGAPVVTVRLTGERVTDADLSHLAGFTRLRRLDLSYSRVSDDGLPYLKSLSELEALDLSGTRIAGPGLESLKGLAKLTSLELFRTEVADDALPHLRAYSHLTYLGLRGTRVSDEGVKGLRTTLPQASIDR